MKAKTKAEGADTDGADDMQSAGGEASGGGEE